MFPTFDNHNNVTTGILAGGIGLILVLGGITAVVRSTSDDTPSPTEQQQQQQEVDAQAQAQAEELARIREEQDKLALGKIENLQEACRTRFLPEATQRAETARQQLRELEEANNAVLEQLPPGKAKDTLAAQLPADVESANALITAEERSIETRCQMAFTIYQYTRDIPPPPPPDAPPP